MPMTNVENQENAIKICLFGQTTNQPLSNSEP